MHFDISQLATMNTDEIEKRIDEVLLELWRIRAQLEVDGLRRHNNDVGDWCYRANFALRMKGREHQLLCQELAKRKKVERENAAIRFERCYMYMARSRLPPELHSELMSATYVACANYTSDVPMLLRAKLFCQAFLIQAKMTLAGWTSVLAVYAL